MKLDKWTGNIAIEGIGLSVKQTQVQMQILSSNSCDHGIMTPESHLVDLSIKWECRLLHRKFKN